MEKRGLEISVGIFLLVGLACLAYLSFQLGDIEFLGSSGYQVRARFSNVSGLKEKALVTMAGVEIGQVKKIALEEGQAQVTLNIREDVRLEEDVIAHVKTAGIIGDKYIAISPGAMDDYIPPGGQIIETLPPFDLEEALGKFIFGKVESE